MDLLMQFMLAIFVLVLILIGPGFLLLRAIGLCNKASATLSPIISLFVYLLLAIIYPLLGMPCNFLTLVFPYCLLSILFYILRRRGVPKVGHGSRLSLASLSLFFAYILCMGLTYCYVYLSEISGPDFFVQGFDSVFHLNLARSFLESGNYSPLSCSAYVGNSMVPLEVASGSFYPAAWHLLVAACSELTKVDITVAASAVTAFSVIYVFTTGFYWLISLVHMNRQITALGALVVPAFIVFPWSMMIRGEQYPQLLSFCLIPAVVSQLISTTQTLLNDGKSLRSVVSNITICAASLFTLALSQPNSVFTAGIFILFYWLGVSCWHVRMRRSNKRRESQRRLSLMTVVLCTAAVIWVLLYKAPFMRDVVEYSGWQPYATAVQALANLFCGQYVSSVRPQIVLSIITIIGFIVSLCDARLRWLDALAAFISLIYIVDISCSGVLQHLMAGFWYSDPDRIASMLSMSFILLAVVGLYSVWRLVLAAIDYILDSNKGAADGRSQHFLTMLLVSIIFIIMVFFPNYKFDSIEVDTAFGEIKERFESLSTGEYPSVLDNDEKLFVDCVKQLVPEDALIINIPDDGSAFLYGIDGLNIFYRRNYFHDVDPEQSNETKVSYLIRSRLYEYSENAAVQRAVRDIGARYVLLLDTDVLEGDSRVFHTYEEEEWKGIVSIDDSTQGFTLILKEGDMRLYQINTI